MQRLSRYAFMATFVLMAQLLASAQSVPTVLVTLPQISRTGTFTTGSAIVAQGTTGDLELTLQISPADYGDTTKQITLRLYRFDGLRWDAMGEAPWNGGHVVVDGVSDPDPLFSVTVDPWVLAGPATIRAELDVPSAVKVGCTVSLRTR